MRKAIYRVYNVGKNDIAVRVYTDISSLEREDIKLIWMRK